MRLAVWPRFEARGAFEASDRFKVFGDFKSSKSFIKRFLSKASEDSSTRGI